MSLKIVIFEDVVNHYDKLCRLFADYNAEFHYYDLETDPTVLQERCEEIARFGPDFIVVDLIKQKATIEEIRDPGVRIVRSLCQSELTRAIPVIAYSITLQNDPPGRQMIETMRQYGAKTIRKVKNVHGRNYATAERFFDAAGMRPSE